MLVRQAAMKAALALVARCTPNPSKQSTIGLVCSPSSTMNV
jgi:hypothetical protein